MACPLPLIVRGVRSWPEEKDGGLKPPLCPHPLQVNRVCACFPSGMM